MLHKNA